MIVDAAIYRKGHRVELDVDSSDLSAMRARCGKGDFMWVGMYEPGMDELDEVAGVFRLPELAIEDVANSRQRPKLERYGDVLFLILKTLWYVDEEDAVETGEVDLFVGSDFVVTVRRGHGMALKVTRRMLESREQMLEHGPSAVVYAVCDQVVDAYGEVADALTIDVEEVEETVFGDASAQDSERIYVLKRELAEMRRAVLPLKEPLSRFTAGVVRGIDPAAAPYFRDVADHLARVQETMDSLDSLLSTAFDAHMAQISMRQNEDMRKISAGAALVVVPTLIAGIYGMNFDHMPELHWAFGYPFALLLMALVSGVLFVAFKRSNWL